MAQSQWFEAFIKMCREDAESSVTQLQEWIDDGQLPLTMRIQLIEIQRQIRVMDNTVKHLVVLVDDVDNRLTSLTETAERMLQE